MYDVNMNGRSITMTTSTAAATVPGYVAGTWEIDPVHSEVGFVARHMMVSKVRGRFTSFSGELVLGEDPLQSSVTATIDLTSIQTGNEQRDQHIRSADLPVHRRAPGGRPLRPGG
jgi:polyisoprenoid-binding protein YceI